ncbi:MAG: patatin-like phospholipase family protein [Lachnospiraceae bacterium]|nr:patatin-like phospholipase family protein [Lachnospiraceae bacterium]
MLNLEGKRVGLVLSGGGAKGGYQVGMFEVLEQIGLDRSRLVLAGTSIGAMNSLMYAARDKEAVWDNLHGIATVDGMDDAALSAYLEKAYPDEKLMNNQIPVYVCAYCVEDERPVYFLLNGRPAADQRKLMMASAAYPSVYPTVHFEGKRYIDGGIIPPGLKNPAKADKIPIAALKGLELDVVIVSYLDPGDHVDHSFLPQSTQFVELHPSRELEHEPGTGTLDFSDASLLWRRQLGYEETLKAVSAY